MKKTVGLFIVAAVFICGSPASTEAQKELTIGLYVPNGPLLSSSERSAYVRRLASAIQEKLGVPVRGKAFIRYGDLKRSKVDFAVIDGLCVAVMKPGRVIATSTIQGKARTPWGLFSREKIGGAALKGKSISFVKTGCKDNAFIFHAMLRSNVGPNYFSTKVAKASIGSAISQVSFMDSHRMR